LGDGGPPGVSGGVVLEQVVPVQVARVTARVLGVLAGPAEDGLARSVRRLELYDEVTDPGVVDAECEVDLRHPLGG
jgi:hypothetical protein